MATRDHPRSTAAIFGHPLHAMIVPFPVVCFIGALLTDIVYWRTAFIMWSNFSAWLIIAGLVMGGLAAALGLIDYIGSKAVRRRRAAPWHMGINILVMLLQFVNLLVHSRDGWTSVVPEGLALSTVSVVLLLVSGWLGQHLVYRQGVGVAR